MVPLHVSAMDPLLRKTETRSGVDAQIREHKRLATEPRRDVMAPPQQEDQRFFVNSDMLEKLDPATRTRFENIERIKSQVSGLIEKAKGINPQLNAIIEEWEQSETLDARNCVLNRVLLMGGDYSKKETEERKNIADLLQRAASMQKSIAGMEQVGTDQTWKDVETIPPNMIIRSLPLGAEQVLQHLQQENSIQQQQEAVDTFSRLIRLTRASKTMACLQIFDFRWLTPIAEAFFSVERNRSWNDIPLILNNNEPSVRLIIPASNNEARYTSIIPTIIPAGIGTTVNGVRTIAPSKIPTQEENLQVRKLVMEAFEVFYGSQVKEWFPGFDDDNSLLMTAEITHMFLIIEQEYQAREISIPVVTTAQIRTYQQAPDALIKDLIMYEDDQIKRQAAMALFEQTNREVDERLTSQNKILAQAAWYGGEAVVRSAGVAVKTVANIVMSKIGRGALVGATTGVTATLAHVGILAETANSAPAFVFSGLAGALVGTIMGHPVGLNEREAPYAVISSSILTLMAVPFLPHVSLLATAATLGGIGAVAGGLPFILKNPAAVTAAAQQAWNHYTPDVALEKARTALYRWRNPAEGYTSALTLMQQAQEIDLKAMEALHAFFERFVLLNHATAVQEIENDENDILPKTMTSPEVMTLEKARDILINQIKQRIYYREDLMNRLQTKLDAIPFAFDF